MKRITALILLTVLSLLLASCGNNAASDPTAAEAVTEPSATASPATPEQLSTESETQPPAEQPTLGTKTVVLKASEQKAEMNDAGVFTYTNKKYGWSVDIPAVWNEYGYITEDDDSGSLCFMHEVSRVADNHMSGEVFTLYTVPADQEIRGNWGDTEISRNDQYKVCWDKPSDVQYDMQYSDEYHALVDTRQSIFDSIRW